MGIYTDRAVKLEIDDTFSTQTWGIPNAQSKDFFKQIEINCVEPVNPKTRPIVFRRTKRPTPSDKSMCRDCRALKGVGGCQDFNIAEAKSTQSDLPDFSFYEIHNDFTY